MSDKIKTVYIAGPISSDPRHRSKFTAAADLLMKRRCAVINPVKMCWDIRWNPRYEVLAMCFAAVAGVDCLALLPNWEISPGTIAELGIFQNTHADDAEVMLISGDCKSIDGFKKAGDFDKINYKDILDAERAADCAKIRYGLELNPR